MLINKSFEGSVNLRLDEFDLFPQLFVHLLHIQVAIDHRVPIWFSTLHPTFWKFILRTLFVSNDIPQNIDSLFELFDFFYYFFIFETRNGSSSAERLRGNLQT